MIGEAKMETANINFDFSSAQCLFCSAIGLVFVNKLRDDDKHWAAMCKSCDYVQLTPLPTAEEDEEYYQTNALFSVSNMDEEDLICKLNELSTFQYNIVKQLVPPPADVIEIGSGYGLFLKKAMTDGYNVSGIEISADKRAYCKKNTGLEIMNLNLIKDDISDELLNKYDIVTLFFSLEHIINPVDFLKRSSKLLKTNGKLIALVPNMNDFMMQLCAEYRDFQYFRPHISYFTSETLTKVFNNAGFHDINVFGKQQYSIENAIHWLRNKKPFLEYTQIKMPRPELEFVNELYKAKLNDELKSDMLVAIGTKL